MTKKEHKRRILTGLISILENDLKGNGAAYIFEDQQGKQLSDVEVDKAVLVGEEILKKLRAMMAR
jgi:hypothetical protein